MHLAQDEPLGDYTIADLAAAIRAARKADIRMPQEMSTGRRVPGRGDAHAKLLKPCCPVRAEAGRVQ
jgi:hypothetical protein